MCNRTLVRERVEQCFQIAENAYNRSIRRPHIRFDKRGTIAGTANYTKWELNFNAGLLDENVEHFVKQTVAHECAHLIDQAVYETHTQNFDSFGRRKKRQPHGRNWKIVMMTLGVPAERCHSYDVSNVKQARRKSKTYTYHCTGCKRDLEMGAIRHKKQITGKASYSHCRGFALIYKG